jgi:hypothetical protein
MTHPYRCLPDEAFWRRAVATIAPPSVDPIVAPKFVLDADTPVMTAGSCFAQHIGRWLKRSGLNFLETEQAHPLFAAEAEDLGYGIYTARYGNVYTSRQLLQLFDRAFGSFTPRDDIWTGDGQFIDPFRPSIQEGGFAGLEDYAEDRSHHFAAVREAFTGCGALVFTLGLTETWRSRVDGAVYPVCPGVAGGTFDAMRHDFWAMGVDDVVADLEGVVARLASLNPQAKLLLTVSPVPLMATADGRHVLAATTLSKSVLRVACDIVERRHRHVAYVPSYEIITGSFSRGAYFAQDLRSVTQAGVAHVMGLFLRHYFGLDSPLTTTSAAPATEAALALARAEETVRVMCDEEKLDKA